MSDQRGPGRPRVGRKVSIRLPDEADHAVMAHANQHWPGQAHRQAKALLHLIQIGLDRIAVTAEEPQETHPDSIDARLQNPEPES